MVTQAGLGWLAGGGLLLAVATLVAIPAFRASEEENVTPVLLTLEGVDLELLGVDALVELLHTIGQSQGRPMAQDIRSGMAAMRILGELRRRPRAQVCDELLDLMRDTGFVAQQEAAGTLRLLLVPLGPGAEVPLAGVELKRIEARLLAELAGSDEVRRARVLHVLSGLWVTNPPSELGPEAREALLGALRAGSEAGRRLAAQVAWQLPSCFESDRDAFVAALDGGPVDAASDDLRIAIAAMGHGLAGIEDRLQSWLSDETVRERSRIVAVLARWPRLPTALDRPLWKLIDAGGIDGAVALEVLTEHAKTPEACERLLVRQLDLLERATADRLVLSMRPVGRIAAIAYATAGGRSAASWVRAMMTNEDPDVMRAAAIANTRIAIGRRDRELVERWLPHWQAGLTDCARKLPESIAQFEAAFDEHQIASIVELFVEAAGWPEIEPELGVVRQILQRCRSHRNPRWRTWSERLFARLN